MTTFNEYQERSSETAIFPEDQGLTYCALGLNGEAGEVAEHCKKMIRDDQAVLTETRRQELKKELGDVLWYLAQTARMVGLDLEDIAATNLEKLSSRKERGVLKGSGDNR